MGKIEIKVRRYANGNDCLAYLEEKMKKILKRVTGVFLCVAMAVGIFCTTSAYAEGADASADNTQAQAAQWPTGPEVQAGSAIIMDAATGTVLYEKDADTPRYPASITKIMTTLLALENCSLDEIVHFSATAVYENEGGTSHIARDLDEEMTLEQCLYAIMLESANECSYAVAEHVGGGDYQKFIDMMNAKAAELGCTNTHFNNCNGLPDPDHVVSARDMALISREAIKNSMFRKIVGTVRYEIPPTNKHADPTPLNNHHQMISAYKGRQNLYEYCIGGKTGWTSDAGNTLVTFAEKDGMTLICVVMSCTAGGQYSDTRTLFDYCFDNFKMYNVAQNETRYEKTQSSDNTLFTEWNAFAKVDGDAQIILPASANFLDTQTEVNYDQASDSILGTLVYSYGGRQVGTANVVTTGAKVTEYPFGEKSGTVQSADNAMQNDTSATAESTDTTKNDTGKKSGISISKNKLLLIGGGVAAAVVIILVIWFLYNNIRRFHRRKEGRDRRYKTIKNNRKWNKRGGC